MKRNLYSFFLKHLRGFYKPILLVVLFFTLKVSAQNAYISNSTSNDVSVINTATNAVVTTIPVGTRPYGVAVSPNGSRAYVANFISNSISVINTATNTVLAT